MEMNFPKKFTSPKNNRNCVLAVGWFALCIASTIGIKMYFVMTYTNEHFVGLAVSSAKQNCYNTSESTETY